MLLQRRCNPACLHAPAATSRSPLVVCAQNRKSARSRRSSKPGSEAEQLLSEYKAVKQAPISSSLSAQPVNGTSSSSSNGSAVSAAASATTTGTSSSRATPITRALTTPIEAGAAAKAGKKGFGRKAAKAVAGAGGEEAPTCPPAPAPAPTPTTTTSSSSGVAGTSKAAGNASPVAAAAAAQQQQPAAAAPAAVDATGTAAGAAGKVPTTPPARKVAGARHEGFESKLTTKPQPPATAAPEAGSKPTTAPSSSSSTATVSPPTPTPPAAAAAAAAAAPAAGVVKGVPAAEQIEEAPAAVSPSRGLGSSEGRALLEDGLNRLQAANDDVAAAEDHIKGLATLLKDARGTLAALRADAAAAQAQVGSEAEHLIGIMTDLLADLSGELELMVDHLSTTRDGIISTQDQLEAAASAAAEAAGPSDVEAKLQQLRQQHSAQLAQLQQQAKEAAAAAAEAAAAEAVAAAEEKSAAAVAAVEQKAAAAVRAVVAAEEQLEAIKLQYEQKEAALAEVTQQNEQLQLDSSSSGSESEGEGGSSAVAAAAAASAAADKLRGALVTQVQCNMSLLDKLGVLAQTVVGLPGLDPSDRVKLASTISQCVLVVGTAALPDDLLEEGEVEQGAGASSSSGGSGSSGRRSGSK